jgi:hypothetical protein
VAVLNAEHGGDAGQKAGAGVGHDSLGLRYCVILQHGGGQLWAIRPELYRIADWPISRTYGQLRRCRCPSRQSSACG